MKNLKHLLPLICLTFITNLSKAQIPYSEDFTGQNNKGVIGPNPNVYDTTGMDWVIDVSATNFVDANDYFKVNTVSSNEIFEARDTKEEVIWKSPIIDITGEGLVDLSVDLSEVGTMESTDYIKVYYILNGSGVETIFSNNGENFDDFTSITASENAVSGTSVQIVIRIDNNADVEKHRFENVSISAATGYNTPSSGDVLITEYAKNGTKAHSYLELYNTTGSPVSLADCKIISSGSNNGVYDFSTDILGYAYIPANGFLILNSDASQSNFESKWGVTIGSSVIYTRTELTIFKNNNTFKLKQGGTEGVDDGTLIDESSLYPSDGNRTYQMPLGYWTNNEDLNTNATPGSLGTYENITEVNLAYADGSWQKATGYAHSSPSSSTSAATALVMRGDATFGDGSQLKNLTIMSDAGTSITTESVTISTALVLADNASLTVTGSGSLTCSGSITVEREGHNLTTDYNVWGSPFSSDLSMGSVFTNHYNCDFYVFEASTQSWKYDETVGGSLNCSGNFYTVTSGMAISSTDAEGTADGNFDVGRGYFVAGHSSNGYEFKAASSGTLNNGDISVNIFGSSTTATDGSNDWNLISNPYPSAISVDDFLSENSGKIANAVYLYNPGNGLNTATSYDTYNSSHTSNTIASCQGFYVDGSTSTDGLANTIKFKNSMRDNSNSDFRSILSYMGVYLDVTDLSGENDPTRIYFDANSQDSYDNHMDALKLPNGDFNFCSKLGNQKLVFNGLSELNTQTKVVPLYFQTYETSVYTISLDSLVGSFIDKDVLLEDRYMRKFHNLKQQGYVFSSSPKEWANRFYLHVIHKKSNTSSGNSNTDTTITVTSIKESMYSNLKAFYANDEIIVSLISQQNDIEFVEIINANGQIVKTKQSNVEVLRIATNDISKGIYFVKIALSSGEVIVKQVVIQ